MSNDLAIATVTASLKRFLGNALTHISGVSITVGQPDQKDATTNDHGRVNISLYQVTQNPGWRNADLPTRRPDGSLSQRPQLALDLHYLFSFYGDKTTLLPERLMGIVMKTLHVQPFLTRQMIRDTVGNQEFLFLQNSNLADQSELIKFSPVSLSLEELSKIWSIFFQTQYVLSTAYQGTVVLIEPDYTPVESLPVSDRSITVDATPPPEPVSPPTITQIHAQAGTSEPITAGSILLIQGQALTKTAIAYIQISEQSFTSDEFRIENSEISLRLTPSLSAGVKTLQIVYQNGDRSNLAKFILRPQLGTVTLQAQPRQIQFTLNLPVVKGQKVVILLDHQTADHNYSFAWIATETITAENIISIAVESEIVVGDYEARVQVDGAESPRKEVTLL